MTAEEIIDQLAECLGRAYQRVEWLRDRITLDGLTSWGRADEIIGEMDRGLDRVWQAISRVTDLYESQEEKK